MKRIVTLSLVLVLILSVFSGCAPKADSAQLPGEESKGTVGEKIVTVSNVDDFLSAVAPDTTIVLEPGTYDLTAAETYGKRSGNPYVKWADYHYGAGLKLHDVENLTITGSGSTKILTREKNAAVLTLEDCLNIKLSNLTIGHMAEKDSWDGAVLRLVGCEGSTLSNLDLPGNGSIAVTLDVCTKTVLEDCSLYDCSVSGMELYGCNNTQIRNTAVRGIGSAEQFGFAALYVSGCMQTAVQNCSFTDNAVSCFLSGSANTELRVQGCSVSGNEFSESVYNIYDGEATVYSDTLLEQNSFPFWYGQYNVWVTDENGQPVHPEERRSLSGYPQPAAAEPVISGELETVCVSSPEEFLSAIGSNREVVLMGDIDLSGVASAHADGDAYFWEEVYDGWGLVIRNVSNLWIRSEKEAGFTLSAKPRYADVLTFRSCSGIHLQSLTVGHTEEPGECSGGVLLFSDSEDVLVDSCSLYGCGIMGVTAWNLRNLQIINSQIYECSYGGISMDGVDGAVVGGCNFWMLGGAVFRLTDCQNVLVDGVEAPSDYYGD